MLTGRKIKIQVNNVQDFRNYKVTCDKARNHLGFRPRYGVAEMIASLHQHMDEYGDFTNENFYNIQVFRGMETGD